MTGPGIRAGRSMLSAANAVPFVAPHAALLIDFDNVTMGVRSDLTKELKALLNSDIIRGKVTVQRAYADWRRYPQYVMPLTERSIDMIWATAVGSTKKNATDIRLAIDAIELVFTRPEIGTFIILSGDSDFSSLVLKLKEYGKYVVGIGIRESASDLLIQNCDEYYSYSELAGLNKEVDTPSVQRDPWELVRDATARMVQQGDVMRSDRLKQVMQQIDANFDERNAGFNRFSKFVAEAATRGLISLTKLENGQFEVGPVAGTARAVPAPELVRADENGRRGRTRRGRDRDRGRKEPVATPTPAAARAPAPAPARAPAPAPAPAPPASSARLAPPAPGQMTLSGAFDLLRKALGELPTPARHELVRARMAALHGREDPLLRAGRFARLLRQANDAEIADVKKTGDDEYELTLSRVERARMVPNGTAVPMLAVAATDGAAGEPPATPDPAAGRPATLRFRRGSRGPLHSSAVPMVGMVQVEAPPPPEAEKETPTKPARSRGRRRSSKPAKAPTGSAETAAETEPAVVEVADPETAPDGPSAGRARRGRGRRKVAKS